jgi:transposase-like protein
MTTEQKVIPRQGRALGACQAAALKLMRKLLKKYGFVPDKLVTDDLRSYRAAVHDLGISNRHERGRWRNNRAENAHNRPDDENARWVQPKDFSQLTQLHTTLSMSNAISFQRAPPSLSRVGDEHVACGSRGR